MANSVDSDEAQYDLSLHCLYMSFYQIFGVQNFRTFTLAILGLFSMAILTDNNNCRGLLYVSQDETPL